jgi:hypothetical protein
MKTEKVKGAKIEKFRLFLSAQIEAGMPQYATPFLP